MWGGGEIDKWGYPPVGGGGGEDPIQAIWGLEQQLYSGGQVVRSTAFSNSCPFSHLLFRDQSIPF